MLPIASIESLLKDDKLGTFQELVEVMSQTFISQ